MAKGRKKIPTKIKEMQGTVEKSRTIENDDLSMYFQLGTKIKTKPNSNQMAVPLLPV